MNKNKLFKVFVMIAFIMCSCEDNFDPKMYGTLNVSNYPVTEAEYESFMMTCYMPFTTTWTYWIGAGTSGNQHGWYIPAGGVLKFFDYPTDEVAVWNNGWGGGYYFLSKADFSQCVYYASGTLSDENPNHFPKVSEISYFTNVIGTLEKASTEVVSEERKREFIAEARLCRGLMMYYLLHVYGPVPFAYVNFFFSVTADSAALSFFVSFVVFASFFPQPAAITAAAANTPIANTPFLNFFIIIFSFYLSYFLRAFPAKKFPRLCMHCVIIISTTTSEYISVKLKRL